MDLVYIRKERKTSGTRQQLEGPNHITKRSPDSSVVKGVWLDNVNSTGSSLKAGVEMLKAQYNIKATHAFYRVDRYQDRQKLAGSRQHLASPLFDDVEIKSLYNLEQVEVMGDTRDTGGTGGTGDTEGTGDTGDTEGTGGTGDTEVLGILRVLGY